MVKDYTVLDGMINNQGAVLKAAYDRGYVHGMADGKDSMASKLITNYDDGFRKGFQAGSDAVMENVVKKILKENTALKDKEKVTKDLMDDALGYIERLITSGLGKKKSLKYLRKFIESEKEEGVIKKTT